MNPVKEKGLKYIFLACACVSIVAVFLICFYLFVNGLPAMFEIGFGDFLFGMKWKPTNGIYGILPMIVGSIYVTAGAIIVGVPIGILCAIYLVFFCPKKMLNIFKPAIDLLAGIPSIVYGFFGLVVIVPLFQYMFGGSGKGILTASVLLGIMILPTIVSISYSSLKAIPDSYYQASLALGASHERSVFFICLKAAKSGVLASVILGVGRAIGETMAVIMVAENSPIMPTSILSGVRTMTANVVMEMSYATGMHRNALIATAVVLFVFILLINISFSCIKNKEAKQS